MYQENSVIPKQLNIRRNTTSSVLNKNCPPIKYSDSDPKKINISKIILNAWHLFCIKNDTISKKYPNLYEVSLFFLDNKENIIELNEVYYFFEKIFNEPIIEHNSNYVSIRFLSDSGMVNLVKMKDEFMCEFLEFNNPDMIEAGNVHYILIDTLELDTLDKIDKLEVIEDKKNEYKQSSFTNILDYDPKKNLNLDID